MRYTFGLDSGSIATSSKITLDGSQAPDSVRYPGLDLNAVVQRVRELVKENEELGDLVLEAGKVDIEEWELALEGEQWLETVLLADRVDDMLTVRFEESHCFPRVCRLLPFPNPADQQCRLAISRRNRPDTPPRARSA